MARIPWPSTAVNVSILCKRPGGGGGGEGEGTKVFLDDPRKPSTWACHSAPLSRPRSSISASSLLSPLGEHGRASPRAIMHPLLMVRARWEVARPTCFIRPTALIGHVFSSLNVFSNPSHHKAVDKIPGRAGSATQTHEHTRICLTVRTRLFPFILPALRAKRRPGRAPRAPSHTSSFENECHLVIETAH